MNILKISFSKYLLTVLFVLSIILQLPTPLQAGVNPVNPGVSVSELPISKKEKTKKKNKRNKDAENNKGFFQTFILFSIIIAFFAGIIMFGIGIPIGILGLWLSGIILFGGLDLFFSLYFIFSRLFIDKDSGPFGLLAYSLIFFYGIFINLILGLTFLIWGIIAAFPVMWIVGAALLLLAILHLIGILVNLAD
jgi:hypothetical protein